MTNSNPLPQNARQWADYQPATPAQPEEVNSWVRAIGPGWLAVAIAIALFLVLGGSASAFADVPTPGVTVSQEADSDAAYAAAQVVRYGGQPGYPCGTDAQCALWQAEVGNVVRPLTPTEVNTALAGIPVDHECSLSTADGVTWGLVADTDPRCAAWWAQGPLAPPHLPPFNPYPLSLV